MRRATSSVDTSGQGNNRSATSSVSWTKRCHPTRLFSAIAAGAINDASTIAEIEASAPDLLVAYGCSLVKGSLLDTFKGRFLNVHLGLSPYYRGSGTNFWPLVGGRPEYVGATFMHIDPGVDTGEVIDQIRARVVAGDSPHSLGNRLIADMFDRYVQIIRRFDALQPVEPFGDVGETRYFRQADFSAEAVRDLYRQFDDGLLDRYLDDQDSRDAAVPIRHNAALESPRR